MARTIREQVEEPTTVTLTPPPDAAPVEPPESAYEPEAEPEPEGIALNAPTPLNQIKTRHATNKAGQPVMKNGQPLVLNYVTARFVQDRLDAAVGPNKWQTSFETVEGGIRCGIGIQTEDDNWVWKFDAAPYTNIEPLKGGHSDAFKRAAVHWGIARDLYEDESDADPIVVPQAQPQWGQMPQAQTGQPPVAMQQQPLTAAQMAAPPQWQQPQGQPVAMVNGAPQWVCPIHQDVRQVPAGFSQRTQRPYRAFLACPVPGCDEKGPSV